MKNQSQAKAGVTEPVAPKGDSPSSIESKPSQNGTPSVNGSDAAPQEKLNTSQENIPFGDKRHPEYKRFKELTESNKKYKQQFEQLNTQLAELRGFKDSMIAQRGQSEQIAPEQKQALQQLFQMGLSVPEVKDMIAKAYGLDRLDAVHKDFSSFKESWEGQQYESEMGDVLKTAKDLGLDPEEVESELQEHVNSHPFFSDKNYYKGGVWAAFRDKYWDKVGELKTRQENSKLIAERDRLKNGQTQSTADTSSAAPSSLPKEDGVRRNIEVIRRAGGLDKLPFFR